MVSAGPGTVLASGTEALAGSSRWRPAVAAVAVFVLGLGLTGAAAVWQARHGVEEASSRFDELAQRTADRVAARMQTHEYGLRGALGAVEPC